MSDLDWLKTAIEKIDEKMDKLDNRLDNQNVVLAEQKTILEEHQRRSLASEENLDMLRQEFKPVEKHVQIVNFIFKAIGFIATISGGILAIIKFLVS